MTVSRLILLRMRNVSDKSCKKSTFVFNNIFCRKSCLYDIMWKKCGGTRESPCDDITRRKAFACRITKATYTLSEYVVFIAFPRQQWFRERASL